jgi:hypothetical protein
MHIRVVRISKKTNIQAFYDGIKHKPETTFGNVKAYVLADKDPLKWGGLRRCAGGAGVRDTGWLQWVYPTLDADSLPRSGFVQHR